MQETRTALADWMAEHNIDVSVRYDTFGRDDDGWERNVYRFHVEIAGDPILDNAPFYAGTGITDVSSVDVIASLLSDAQSIDGCADFLDWADNIGALQDATPARLRKLRDDFHEISARRTLLVERIGDDALTVGIDHALEL